MELLHQFPALWVILGFMLAGAAFLLANRKVFQWQAQATSNLRETLNEQITALTKEKNEYRSALHAEREIHQSAKLRIQELELRPDITALFKASESFYAEQTKTMTLLVNSIHEHDKAVSDKMRPVYDSLKTIGEGIKELLQRGNK